MSFLPEGEGGDAGQGMLHAQGSLAKDCPQCGAGPEHQELRNYSMMWHDGDIHCKKCGAYVRMYDAG